MISYRGKWVFAPDKTLLNDRYIVCKDHQILEVTPVRPTGKVIEYDGLICPGLINAHTHLEFSDLRSPLGKPRSDFVEWIGSVIQYRRDRDPATQQATIQRGIAESVEAGVCAIGEISTFDWVSEFDPAVSIVDFREILGFRLEQTDEIASNIHTHLSAQLPAHSTAGLSPHAPYSINRESLQEAVALSRRRKCPLAMHLAETQSELELLKNHRGPFHDLLSRLELWTADNFPLGTTPLDFLRTLAKADKALVIHGNYLNESEFRFLAEHSDTLRLVYCPRTHAYFGHSTYPMDWVSKYQIKLAIGTDSRASNPDLSVWRELELIHQKFPAIDPPDVIEMGTLNGAQALGLDRRFGTIAPGKQSAFFFAPAESELTQALIDRETQAQRS